MLAADALAHGISLWVARLAEGNKGFALMLKCLLINLSFTCVNKFSRIARAQELLPKVLKGLHLLVLAIRMPHHGGWCLTY